jgi:arabinofuranosyltransferase
MKRPAFLLLFGLLLIALLGLAWSNRFCLDDAYISFRYARNLVRGRGLVYNEGERVEGYTNFLWVLLVAAGMRLGFDPIVFSQILGMVAFAGSLLLTYRMATDITDSKWLGLVAMLVLGTNYSFSAFATGGLETSLQACLLTGSVCAALAVHAENGVAWPVLVALSSLLGFAVLTHPDSALFLSLLPLAARQVFLRRTKIGLHMLALLGPFLLLIVPWAAWKIWYYGDLLPNTFYAKATQDISVRQGLDYVWRFLWTYTLWPFGALGLLALPAVEKQHTRWLLSCLILSWFGYVIWIGGDSMEYRFLVPVLPLAFILITWLATRYARPRAVQITLIGMVLWGSLGHALTLAAPTRPKVIVEPIKDLGAYVEKRGWEAAGRKLGEVFGPDSDVVIATTAAGALPYYADLTTVDMLGLNDHWIARYGIDVNHWNWPGHRRVASLSHLASQGVHLVIGNPQVVTDPNTPSYCKDTQQLTFVQQILYSGAMIEIPIQRDRVLLAIYLTPSQTVDEAIEREGWKVYPCGVLERM